LPQAYGLTHTVGWRLDAQRVPIYSPPVTSTGTSTACPTCGVALPVLEPYMTWCHECGWNLKAPDTPPPKSRLDALYARAGVHLDSRLVTQLSRAEQLSPRLTSTRVAAYAIAGAVHLLNVALLAAIVLATLYAIHHPWAFVIVLFLLAVAYVLRPRPGKLPTKGVVGREDAPNLYALCDEIAAALGTKPIHLLVIDARFNAEWAILGWRRRRTLTLGLPLLAMVPPQARVALIAHEFAHARNGDSTRGFFVGSAVNALADWYGMLGPQEEGIAATGLEPLANLFLWILSRPIWWLLHVELQLLLRDSQRAEYLADLLAADVAGADAVVELHERLLLETAFFAVVHHASRETWESLLAEARLALDSVPERERERRRRVARLETVSLGSTHPPTGSRIDLVQRRSRGEPKVVVGEARSAAIDAELQSKRKSVESVLVDNYRASLYY
jgi:Zn-dependent protease with chaperone function